VLYRRSRKPKVRVGIGASCTRSAGDPGRASRQAPPGRTRTGASGSCLRYERESGHRGKDGAFSVEGAIDQPGPSAVTFPTRPQPCITSSTTAIVLGATQHAHEWRYLAAMFGLWRPRLGWNPNVSAQEPEVKCREPGDLTQNPHPPGVMSTMAMFRQQRFSLRRGVCWEAQLARAFLVIL
jgi:hypothetical protein